MPADAYSRMAHLLRRAAFGARPDEINNVYLRQGFEATVDQLVNYETVAEDPAVSAVPTDTAGLVYDIRYRTTRYTVPNTTTVEFHPDAMTMDRLAGWWLQRMIRTKRPLQELMVLFWHDHFATSYSKINNAKYMYWQNKLCREQATGNFRTLLKGINRDPAMIIWLDSYLNRKTSPNENYARELLELFALGFDYFLEGAYTEADVQQAARAFTGWRLKGGTVEQANGNGYDGHTLLPEQLIDLPPNTNDNSATAQIHDYGNKTVFGVNQNFNGDDIVDLILNHEPQRTFAAKFIGKKLWEFFAYEDPEAHVIDHLAAVAKRTDFNIKAILRDMFLNVKEFYSDKAIQAQVKQPAHFIVSAIRLLQADVFTGNQAATYDANNNQTNGGTLNNNLRVMGQWLFWPPDVSGWPGGTDWISTSQYLSRSNWANSFATNRSTTTGNTGIPIQKVLDTSGLGATPTAEQLVDYFSSLLVQRPLAPNVRQALVDYMKKADNGTIGTFSLATDRGTGNQYKKVRGLIHLLLARPEFQVW